MLMKLSIINLGIALLFCSQLGMAQTPSDKIYQIAYSNQLAFVKLCQLKKLKSQHFKNQDFWDVLMNQAALCSDWLTYQECVLNLQKLGQDTFVDNFTQNPQLNPASILETIDSVANHHQIIFINELHGIPQHALLVHKLLKRLYQKGFRHLLMEEINQKDASLNSRKYPTQQSGNSSIKQPTFGSLVRKALKIGYQVQGYDIQRGVALDSSFKDYGISFKGKKWMVFNQIREWNQAVNIYKQTIKKDSKTKVIVYGGMQHVFKAPIPWDGIQYWPMGALFVKLTNITPFVINQRDYHITRQKGYASFYAKATKDLKTPLAICFRNQQTDKFLRANTLKDTTLYNQWCDMNIFHAIPTFKKGKPDWQFSPQKQLYQLKRSQLPTNLKGDFMIQAFYKNEPTKAGIPIDQVVASSSQHIPPLLLPKNAQFKFVALDNKGKQYELEVDK